MSKILRSTDIKSALRSRQRGFLMNPYRLYVPPPAGDPYWASVVLLLKGDGTDGATTFTDSSISAHSLTLTGNARVRTAQSKFGGSSLYFDGTGDTAYTDSSSDFYFPGDFTVECWVYFTNSGAKYLLGNGDNSKGWPFVFQSVAATNIPKLMVNGSDISGSGDSLAINTWHHFATSRTGSTLNAYANGIQYISTTVSGAIGPVDGYSFAVNSYYDPPGNITYSTEAYYDDIRVTKGVGRYPAAFTPSTLPFPVSA